MKETNEQKTERGRELVREMIVSGKELMSLCNEWKGNMTYDICRDAFDEFIINVAIMVTKGKSQEETSGFLRECGFKGKIF